MQWLCGVRGIGAPTNVCPVDRPPPVSHRLRVFAFTLGVVAGCGHRSDASTAAGCDKVQRQEVQFPSNHVLPGTPEPRYLSEPPTSGPHLIPPKILGRYEEPLSRPIQVGILESGKLLVQYRDAADGPAADALGGADVVVAPNPTLSQPVVLTAWLRLQRCQRVDADVVDAFRRKVVPAGPSEHR